MAYATREDMEELHGLQALASVADRNNDGDIDNEAVIRALQDASGVLDGYLTRRYDLSVLAAASPTPVALRHATVEIAMYQLANSALSATEDIRQRYEDALAWAKDIASGKALIPGIVGNDGDANPSQSDTRRYPSALFGSVRRI